MGCCFPAMAQKGSELNVRAHFVLSRRGAALSLYPPETIEDFFLKIRSLRSKTDDDDQSEAVWSAGTVPSCPTVVGLGWDVLCWLVKLPKIHGGEAG